MTTNVQIRLASDRVNTELPTNNAPPRLYSPGEIITNVQGYMRSVAFVFFPYIPFPDFCPLAGVMARTWKRTKSKHPWLGSWKR